LETTTLEGSDRKYPSTQSEKADANLGNLRFVGKEVFCFFTAKTLENWADSVVVITVFLQYFSRKCCPKDN